MPTITFKSEGYDEESRGAAFVNFVKQLRLSPSAHVVFWLEEAGDEELYEHAALPEALRALDNGLRPSAVFHLEAGTMPSSVRGVVLRMARQGRVSSFTTDDPDFFMQLLRTPTVSLPAVCLAWQIELENFDTDLLIKALERFIARNRSARRIELRRVCYVNLPDDDDHEMPKRFVDWVMQTLPGTFCFIKLLLYPRGCLRRLGAPPLGAQPRVLRPKPRGPLRGELYKWSAVPNCAKRSMGFGAEPQPPEALLRGYIRV